MRKLVGFEMLDKNIPRHGYTIYNEPQQPVGKVTSGTQSPTLKRDIRMGYVDTRFANEGTQIFIDIRNKILPVRIYSGPFVNTSVN